MTRIVSIAGQTRCGRRDHAWALERVWVKNPPQIQSRDTPLWAAEKEHFKEVWTVLTLAGRDQLGGGGSSQGATYSSDLVLSPFP